VYQPIEVFHVIFKAREGHVFREVLKSDYRLNSFARELLKFRNVLRALSYLHSLNILLYIYREDFYSLDEFTATSAPPATRCM
jgi:hypothetical protein